MASADLPLRGEIWLTAFGAGRVGEPAKTRPAVVLSADGQLSGSVYDLVVVVPLSASLAPTVVRPTVWAGAETGLGQDSVIVVRSLRAVSLNRLIRRVGCIDADSLEVVGRIVQTLLGLTTD